MNETKLKRYRCPKNGRFTSLFKCSKCQNPPEPAYDICTDFNIKMWDSQ